MGCLIAPQNPAIAEPSNACGNSRPTSARPLPPTAATCAGWDWTGSVT